MPSSKKTNHLTNKPNGILTNKIDANTSVKNHENQNLFDSETGQLDELKFKLRQILNFLEAGARDLARLSALQPCLSDCVVMTRFPHLTAAIFSQLVNLTSGVNKEAGRIAGGLLESLLVSLPFVQSVRLVNNVVRAAAHHKTVAVLKTLDKLIQQTDHKHLREYTRELMAGLLKVSFCL